MISVAVLVLIFSQATDINIHMHCRLHLDFPQACQMHIKSISNSSNLALCVSYHVLISDHMYLVTLVRILDVILNSSFFLHNLLPNKSTIYVTVTHKNLEFISFFQVPPLITNFRPFFPSPKHILIFTGFPDLVSLPSHQGHTLWQEGSL